MNTNPITIKVSLTEVQTEIRIRPPATQSRRYQTPRSNPQSFRARRAVCRALGSMP
jgi:hypothetical protein